MPQNEDIANVIESVRLTAKDIKEATGKIKLINEQIQEVLSGLSDYDEVVRLTDELAKAKEKLGRLLQSNERYNDLMEEKAQLSSKVADQRQILSDHLVWYRLTTNERQIEMGSDGDACDVVVTGRLGRASKYQTNLFGLQKEAE